MPALIPPCLPTPATAPPAGGGWLHELKLDGWRIQVVKDGARIALFTRGGNDLAARLPRTTAYLAALTARSIIIDGELVAPDGLFSSLPGAVGRDDVIVAAFDLLEIDGADVHWLPLVERKARLERLIGHASLPALLFVAGFDDGAEVMRAAETHGAEGVVSKRRDAPYRSGRRPEWVKVKTRAWLEANRERWKAFER